MYIDDKIHKRVFVLLLKLINRLLNVNASGLGIYKIKLYCP